MSHVVPRLSALDSLTGFDRIIVLANCRIRAEDFPCLTARDLLVIFNNPSNIDIARRAQNLLWVHRHNAKDGTYFGYPSDVDLVPLGRTCICAGNNPPDRPPDWCTEAIASSTGAPELDAYPIGRSIVLTIKPPRQIVGPSTGFTTLALLNQHKRLGFGGEIHAFGFGQFPNGWKGHAWSFERKAMSRMDIHFWGPELQPEGSLWRRSFVPDLLMRLSQDTLRLLLKR